jgi:hypothetical protein
VFSKRAAGETTLADGQAVKQDGDAALVTEPAVLSEARLVVARPCFELAEDVRRGTVGAQGSRAQITGQFPAFRLQGESS